MLLNFKVNNFRSIKDEIVLDLKATSDGTLRTEAVCNVGGLSVLKSVAIYGPNASGKSNIIRAFAVFRRMIIESFFRHNLPEDLQSESFKLDQKTYNAPSCFEASFLIDGEVLIYGFKITRKKIIAEWLKKEKGNVSLFSRENNEIDSNKNFFREASKKLKQQISDRVLFLSFLSSNNAEISKKIVSLIQNTNVISGVERGNTLNFSIKAFLNNKEMADDIKNIMKVADLGVIDIKADERTVSVKDLRGVPDKFKEIFFKEDSQVTEGSLKFVHKKYHNKLSAEGEELDFFTEESDGTQQMFALSGPIIDTLKGGKVLFIDEVDASLHPMLCQFLVFMFNSKKNNPNNAQLIITSHDTTLMNEKFFRRDQIYFTQKDKFGATELFSLSDISERKGVDFAKRYLDGRYDALPYITDLENMKFFDFHE